jgi:hypothetical protein
MWIICRTLLEMVIDVLGRLATSFRSKRSAFCRPSLHFCFELTWLIVQENFIIFKSLQIFFVHIYVFIWWILLRYNVMYASVRCLLLAQWMKNQKERVWKLHCSLLALFSYFIHVSVAEISAATEEPRKRRSGGCSSGWCNVLSGNVLTLA